MDKSVEALIGMAGLALLALATFAAYRWRQRERVRRVEHWVREYLVAHYGGMPDDLHINCSDDARWPVLVSFNGRLNGARHLLHFGCGGRVATFALLSEKEEQR